MTAWLNMDDLVDYLKTPKSTLYKLTRLGKIPGHKVGRSYRFDRDEVDAWIKRGGLDSARSEQRERK